MQRFELSTVKPRRALSCLLPFQRLLVQTPLSHCIFKGDAELGFSTEATKGSFTHQPTDLKGRLLFTVGAPLWMESTWYRVS